MAGAIKKYPITKSKLLRACVNGFEVEESGVLRASGKEAHRTAFFTKLDGGVDDCEWGRVSLKMQIHPEMVFILRAFASNNEEFVAENNKENVQAFLLDGKRAVRQKYQLFEAAGAVKSIGHQDVLLFGQLGRYLYLSLEILGEGEAAVSDICVWVPADNFYNTFPEVYRTDGDFFHRYLTVFSAMYNDMQEKIDNIDKLFDIDNAPHKLLLVFAGWLGVAPPENLLETEQLRALVRMAHSLIREKGTRQVLEKVIGVLTNGEQVYIVENANEQFLAQGKAAMQSKAANNYNVTILINRVADERLNAQMRYLVGRFSPLRSKVSIVFIGNRHAFDSYCCLDINASIGMPQSGGLDDKMSLNGMSQLR